MNSLTPSIARVSPRGFVGTASGDRRLAARRPDARRSLGPPAAAAGGPDGFGSVSTAPRLPAGFTRTFKSRYVQANGIRQHVVIGGERTRRCCWCTAGRRTGTPGAS